MILKALLVLTILSSPAVGLAHPGRLNSDGCHNVHKDWQYKSGRVVKAGTYHCHRALGRIRLDGKEALQDPNDPGQSADCLDQTVKLLKEMEPVFDDVLYDMGLLTKPDFIRWHETMKQILEECR